MKLRRRSSARLGILPLALLALMSQPLLTNCGAWAQSKAPEGTPAPGPAAEIKVPSGTLDAITAILTRRSIRDYTPHPVPEEMVKLLLEAGTSAPSAMDERSTEFIVINDRKILDEIQKFNPKRLQLKKATVAILVCGNQAKEKKKGLGFWVLDGAVASENILHRGQCTGAGGGMDRDLSVPGPVSQGTEDAESAGTGHPPVHHSHRLPGGEEDAEPL